MAREFSSTGTPLEQESARSLVGRLVGDASALVRNEVALAKAEVIDTAAALKTGMTSLAIAAVILLAGLLALLAAVILGLAQVVEPWLAALIVGAALALIGVLLVQGARRKLAPRRLELDRTQASLREDMNVIARRT